MVAKIYAIIICAALCFITAAFALPLQTLDINQLQTAPVSSITDPLNSPILTKPSVIEDCTFCQEKSPHNMVVRAPKVGFSPPPDTWGSDEDITPITSEVDASEITIEAAQFLKHIGVFRNAQWFLDVNSNRRWDGTSTDRTTSFGLAGDIPVSKYWFGVFRNGQWYYDLNQNGRWDGPSVDRTASFGLAGDIPVWGVYKGGSTVYIGVFRPSTRTWYIDWNGNGRWDGPSTDRQYTFGLVGDVPVVGDWSNSGVDRIGVFRPSTRTWYVDWNGNGRWDGPSTDRQWSFGLAGDIPVTGDWSNSGVERIGVFRNGVWYVDWNGNGRWDGPSVDRQWSFGLAGDRPHVRHFSFAPTPGPGTEITNAHNTWRSEVGTPGMTWNAQLETTAQRWATYMANNNVFQHSPKDGYYRYGSGGTYAGENIAWASYDRSWTDVVSHPSVTSWAGTEKQYYNHAYTFPSCCVGGVCGHYTQVIWRDSTQIGCGKAYKAGNGYYYVCQYWTPGNIVGQKAY